MRTTTTKRWIAGGVMVFTVGLLSWGAFVWLHQASPAVITQAPTVNARHTIIGTSVEGRTIDAYAYGTGAIHLLFVGGMHGGYEWNAAVLAYDFKAYLDTHPESVPANLTVTVIPSLNVDGIYKVIGKTGAFTAADIPSGADTVAGRVNADSVDLNRNFDCNWQPKATWKNKTVSAGTAPFSEPESAALRDLIASDHPSIVVFWHSQSGSVYASECNNSILPQTLEAMNLYASAAGYTAVKSFDAYPVTGDSEGWLASIGIPAITVELKTHTTIEWEQNLAGINALLQYYSKK